MTHDACVDCVDAADKETQVLRQGMSWIWQCWWMMLHVDAVLTDVDSVDMIQNIHSLFYCESFDDACCLCWLCWPCWQRYTSSETRNELEMTVLMEDATCWCCVDWCWQCWRDSEYSLVYCESFDDACCLCWLCWRCWQRNTSSETRNELEMTVLMNYVTCCLCWLFWRCRQRETSSETR